MNAMLDASALFMQGIMFLSMPVKFIGVGKEKKELSGFFAEAIRSFGAFAILFRGVGGTDYQAAKMQARLKYIAEYYNLFDYGIEFTEAEGGMNQKEELFMSGLFELFSKIPLAGDIVLNVKDASEAQYTNFLNAMRVVMSISLINLHQKSGLSEDQIKDYVNFINFASGRGNFKQFDRSYGQTGLGEKVDKSFDLGAVFFFAPRLTVSTLVQPIIPILQTGKATTKLVKNKLKFNKDIGNEYTIAGHQTYQMLAMAGTYLIIYFMLNMGKGDDEPRWKIDLDSTSTEFLKIRKGKTVRALHNRYTQNVRLLFAILQELFGVTFKNGKFYKTEKAKDEARVNNLIMRMLLFKLNPQINNIRETTSKRNIVTGEKIDQPRLQIFLENYLPIILQSVKEMYGQVPNEEVAINTASEFVGMPVSVYKKRTKKKTDRGRTTRKRETSR